MLEQLSGVNDDAIIFERETIFDALPYQYIGMCGISDLLLQGYSESTAGSGICLRSAAKNATASEGLWMKRLFVSGFAEDGIEFPAGAVPMHFEDIDAYFNGRYGVNVVRGNNAQGVYLDSISGDGNSEGLIHLEDFIKNDSVIISNVKSEKRSNPFRLSATGKQENAIVLEDCTNAAITIRGVTHVSSEIVDDVYEAPGAAIKIVAAAAAAIPKLDWAGVAVRVVDGETDGPGPILSDATNSVTVPNGVASGTYGATSSVHHPRAASSSRFVVGGKGDYLGATFPDPAHQVQGTTPAYAWWESDGASDAKNWLAVLSSGEWSLRNYTDAGVFISKVIAAGPSGTVFNGFIGGSESSAPATPAANEFKIYAEDNGSGKTRLMVKFATGAAQQIAIEP
jgi:hypothetical protein